MVSTNPLTAASSFARDSASAKAARARCAASVLTMVAASRDANTIVAAMLNARCRRTKRAAR